MRLGEFLCIAQPRLIGVRGIKKICSVILPFLGICGQFFNKMASEKSPEFRANSNDTNLTRCRRTNHAEAPGNIFHFDIDILDFGFGVIFKRNLTKYELGVATGVPAGACFPSKIAHF